MAERMSPPAYCQYVEGPCDQTFGGTLATDALFLYPSQPPMIAGAIESAVERLTARDRTQSYLTWRDMQSDGRIIFCEICKRIRFTSTVVADVSTLNFNLL